MQQNILLSELQYQTGEATRLYKENVTLRAEISKLKREIEQLKRKLTETKNDDKSN